jgi:hypothetical protein
MWINNLFHKLGNFQFHFLGKCIFHLTPNIKKEDSPVHLEPLFNAVIADPSRMDTLFKGADHEA